MTTIRLAWLLALGKLTVVAFFAIFLIFITRAVDPQKPAAVTKRWAMALAHRQHHQLRQHDDGIPGWERPRHSGCMRRNC